MPNCGKLQFVESCNIIHLYHKHVKRANLTDMWKFEKARWGYQWWTRSVKLWATMWPRGLFPFPSHWDWCLQKEMWPLFPIWNSTTILAKTLSKAFFLTVPMFRNIMLLINLNDLCWISKHLLKICRWSHVSVLSAALKQISDLFTSKEFYAVCRMFSSKIELRHFLYFLSPWRKTGGVTETLLTQISLAYWVQIIQVFKLTHEMGNQRENLAWNHAKR